MSASETANRTAQRVKMAELQPDLDRFAPKESDADRYVRLHTLATNLAASLAFRYGEIAELEYKLNAAYKTVPITTPGGEG